MRLGHIATRRARDLSGDRLHSAVHPFLRGVRADFGYVCCTKAQANAHLERAHERLDLFVLGCVGVGRDDADGDCEGDSLRGGDGLPVGLDFACFIHRDPQ